MNTIFLEPQLNSWRGTLMKRWRLDIEPAMIGSSVAARSAVLTISTMAFAFFPSAGSCGSLTDSIKAMFSSNTNTIAVQVAELPQRYKNVYSRGLDFSPDGRYLATYAENESIDIWDWREGHIIKTIEMPRGSNDGLESNPLQFSLDGRWLASCLGGGSEGENVRIWKTADWSVYGDIKNPVRGACKAFDFSKDGHSLIYAMEGGAFPGGLFIFNIDTWKEEWGERIENKVLNPAALALSPNGEWLAIGGLRLVTSESASNSDEKTNDIRPRPILKIIRVSDRSIQKLIYGTAMGSLAWSPDGNHVAAAGGGWGGVEGADIEVYAAASGKQVVGQTYAVSSRMNIKYSSDGRYFIECDANGRGKGFGVKIWDVDHEKLLQQLSLGDVGNIAISRDSRYLAAGARGRTFVFNLR